MRSLAKTIAAFALGLFFAGAAAADTLELKDGRVLQGRYLGGTQAVVRFEINGDVRTFSVNDVVGVTFTGASGKSSAPAIAPPADAPPADAAPQSAPPPAAAPPPATAQPDTSAASAAPPADASQPPVTSQDVPPPASLRKALLRLHNLQWPHNLRGLPGLCTPLQRRILLLNMAK